jgi:CHAD domain-containing protein
MTTRYREREDKYEVDLGTALPSLDDLVPEGGQVEQKTLHLSSTYYDTAGLDLLASRLTLRRRTGDADSGWQLKVPEGGARTEIRLPPDNRDSVPKPLRDLLYGIRRGQRLRTVARIDTVRTVHRLRDAAGELIVEVADDHVHATKLGDGTASQPDGTLQPDNAESGSSTATVSSWRELEVELGEGRDDESLLEAVGARLCESGARPAGSISKLTHALGRNLPPPPAAEDATSITDLVGHYLRVQYDALVAGDLGLRSGEDVVHPTRVATRRIRSVLRVFRDLFDEYRASHLDGELKWYATLLGRVRDTEVLRTRLDRAVHDLSSTDVLGPVTARIDQHLVGERERGRRKLLEAVSGTRYLALLEEVRAFCTDPPFTEVAAGSAKDEAQRHLEHAQDRLRKRISAAMKPDAHDDVLHSARKAGKRTRYVAELTEPVLGTPASKLVKRATRLQDVLGEHQDSIVAAELLRRLGAAAAKARGENGFTFGMLYAEEQRHADTSRRKLGKFAKKLSH